MNQCLDQWFSEQVSVFSSPTHSSTHSNPTSHLCQVSTYCSLPCLPSSLPCQTLKKLRDHWGKGVQSPSCLRLSVFSFSLASGVLTGFSGGGGLRETSKEALELGIPAPKEDLRLVGEPRSEAIGLESMFPEEVLWLVVALGRGGLLSSLLGLFKPFSWSVSSEDYFWERWSLLWRVQGSTWW